MLTRLADRLILYPTRYPIEPEGKSRLMVDSSVGPFEIWKQRVGPARQPDIFILKFAGTGGRAERATDHPAVFWNDLTVEVWAVNPPGYGGSPGKASLTKITAVADAAFRTLEAGASDSPIVVAGNSLGTLSALHLAACETFAGMIVRNPPPLREVIQSRFGRLSLGASALIANRVPGTLCPIVNAGKSSVPAVFISSRRDRIAPTHLQDLVYQAYQGEQRVVELTEADHADLMNEDEVQVYMQHLRWLRQQWDRVPATSASVPASRAPNA